MVFFSVAVWSRHTQLTLTSPLRMKLNDFTLFFSKKSIDNKNIPTETDQNNFKTENWCSVSMSANLELAKLKCSWINFSVITCRQTSITSSIHQERLNLAFLLKTAPPIYHILNKPETNWTKSRFLLSNRRHFSLSTLDELWHVSRCETGESIRRKFYFKYFKKNY